MVEVTFTPVAEDYVAVQKAMFARQLRSRRFFGRTALLLGVVVLGIFLLLLTTGDPPLVALVIAVGGAASGAVGLAACIGVNRLLLPRRSRRLFVQQKTLHHEHRTIFDATGFRQQSVRADIALPWGELLHWHLGREVLLLYGNDLLAYFIPRRAFDAGQLAQVEAILTDAGLPRR
ncbi:hypothetical protein ASE73_10640 [Sphingomonas sp. Leaf24]|uniref:YcxB family protein n=1 Tax=unclassified Sphingomonas TaxID=196159 RepID=UPI0006F22DB5|nr:MULTISPECIES: YcxB family protein [unclassified Sphingomonas]KQM14601.1 hypothetical protein ASE50_08690 [Sphingomonas sp. Leaf5]KQM87900.1 hypothetical protein ASE73_10640 [Sphingomonas sp. Leaf24]